MFLQSNKRTQLPRILLFILLLLVIIGILQIFSFNPFSGFLHQLTAPLWTARQSASIHLQGFSGLFVDRTRLARENDALRHELAAVRNQTLLLEAYQQENEALKELLGRGEKRDVVVAAVLMRPNTLAYDTLIIDVGSNRVAVGDFVFAHGDFVIGQITEVFRTTSLVRLFSSPGEKTNVSIRPIQLLVEAEGRGGGNFVTQLPRDVAVQEGDIIGLPDLALDVFAVVEEVITTPTGPFQTVLFQNPVNINQLRFVEVRAQ